MQADLRFAIIGCGKIAPRHAAEATRHGTLAAVCDIIPGRADELAATYKAQAFYDSQEMLAHGSYDVVAICTPNGLHVTHAVQALAAGAHVLCEKPLCISTADAEAMIEAADQHQRKLFVVKSTRYNPALHLLKEKIAGNALGNIYSFQLNCFWNRPPAYYSQSWKGSAELDGGTLYTQFSHYIDALLWLLDDTVKEVKGYRRNAIHQDIIAFEDEGVAAIEMSKGTLGGINWSVNSYQRNMEVSLSLLAEKGTIRIAGEYMNRIDFQLLEGDHLQVPAYGEANDYGFYKGSMSNHDKVYENLLLALQNGDHPFANAIDGLKTVQAIEKIYNSLPLP